MAMHDAALVADGAIVTNVSVASTSAASAALAATRDLSSLSTFGLFGRVILSILKVIPGVLYWIGAFATITVPTWLFTLFSTSLTFTLNFTTL